MGKINVANISAGLSKVKSITESLGNLSHFEMVPAKSITAADHNLIYAPVKSVLKKLTRLHAINLKPDVRPLKMASRTRICLFPTQQTIWMQYEC